jgi:hypothetical protein
MDLPEMLKSTPIALFIIICSFFPSAWSAAAANLQGLKFYDVEIIIFKNISVPNSHEFNFPTPSASRSENTLDLSDPVSIRKARSHGFTPLTVDQLRLNDSVQKISESSRYHLLLHTGWRQPGLDESSSIPVWVKGGRKFDSSYSSIDQMSHNNLSSSAEKPKDGYSSMQGLYELEGQITIILSRYLHTRTELVLRKPSDMDRLMQQEELLNTTGDQDLDALEGGRLLLNYALTEQRRMRSKKLHYLDHPEFGMLVLITPYEKKEAETSGGQNTAAPVSISKAVD